MAVIETTGQNSLGLPAPLHTPTYSHRRSLGTFNCIAVAINNREEASVQSLFCDQGGPSFPPHFHQRSHSSTKNAAFTATNAALAPLNCPLDNSHIQGPAKSSRWCFERAPRIEIPLPLRTKLRGPLWLDWSIMLHLRSDLCYKLSGPGCVQCWIGIRDSSERPGPRMAVLYHHLR